MNASVLAKLRAYLRRAVCPLPEIRRHVPMQSSVFDLGCGTGAILFDLIEARQVRRVGGSETSSSLLVMAQEVTSRALEVNRLRGLYDFQGPSRLPEFLRLC